MKIAIKKINDYIYIDKSICLDERYNLIDLSQSPYNYKIITIDDIFSDCSNLDFDDDLSFNVNKYQTRKDKTNAGFKISDLQNWFDIVYTRQEQKLRRLHTLNLMTDDNKSPLEELKNLYVEAEFKRKEIQKLEQIINDGGSDNGIIY